MTGAATQNIIRRTVTRLMVPFIQLFGMYVIVHGDSGPGGGFQGGVILGSSVILYAIVFGAREARAMVSQGASDLLSSAGVLIYAGVGLFCIAAGGKFLEYGVLPFGSPRLASHYGIFMVEVGVGVAVSAVMAGIFFETACAEERGGGSRDA